jgi:hypothetical protein
LKDSVFEKWEAISGTKRYPMIQNSKTEIKTKENMVKSVDFLFDANSCES